MSRTVLWIMTVFLSLAMVALVVIQAYWIKTSIEAEEKQLGLVVNQVLKRSPMSWCRMKQYGHPGGDPATSGQPPQQSGLEFSYRFRSSLVRTEEIYLEDEMEMNEEVIVFTRAHQSIKNQKVEMIDDSVVVIMGEDELPAGYHPGLCHEARADQAEAHQNLERAGGLWWITSSENAGGRGAYGGPDLRIQVEKLLSEKLSERGIEMPFEYAFMRREKTHLPVDGIQ